jgi:hypothetical protein
MCEGIDERKGETGRDRGALGKLSMSASQMHERDGWSVDWRVRAGVETYKAYGVVMRKRRQRNNRRGEDS